ncbi:MAG TPA: hypothetical protein GXZ23_00505 [Clostridiales bacterium]|nr:hypothetical protein [Clostridiales bacterium]
MFRRSSVKRTTVFIVFIAMCFGLFGGNLFFEQIIHGDEHLANMNTINTYTVTVEAARGEILDRNGEKLVENKQIKEVVFEAANFPTKANERNALIIELINLFYKKNQSREDKIPLLIIDGKPEFDKNADSDISFMKSASMLNLNEYATAQNCFDAMVEKYEIEGYSKEDTLKIASVRYNMQKNEFSSRNPYVFASDVDTSLCAVILENNEKYPGVTVSISTARKYLDSSLAVHVIGTVGAISADEYYTSRSILNEKLADENLTDEEKSKLKRASYLMNSEIGKSGIEGLCEEYLRGIAGEKAISVDSAGVVNQTMTSPSVAGNTVITTLHSGIQAVAEKALKDTLAQLGRVDGLNAAGAVVVLDVNTADILACASYPDYDLDTYYEEYDKLSVDSEAPLWNRALSSTYAPGSTFKPAMAVAGLESGVVNQYTTFYCDSIFEFKDTEFSCLKAHGNVNCRDSLNYSCNIYYYNLGNKLGITKMNEYASMFGLGAKTGVELNEASGVLAGLAYREKLGTTWLPGDTIQAAIGQSDNLFTPIQLANYCATIANGGTRYVPHIIKSVVSADYSETILRKEPEIALETGISPETLNIVKLGMYDVATIGTCAEAFANLPVKVAAKTGTSQKLKKVKDEYVKGNNGFIISFGPYENAEIAVAVVIEDIDSGAATAQVAADIYEYYFGMQGNQNAVENIGSLIP